MKKMFEVNDCTIEGHYDCPYLAFLQTEDCKDEQPVIHMCNAQYNVLQGKAYRLKTNLFKKCPLKTVEEK